MKKILAIASMMVFLLASVSFAATSPGTSAKGKSHIKSTKVASKSKDKKSSKKKTTKPSSTKKKKSDM